MDRTQRIDDPLPYAIDQLALAFVIRGRAIAAA